MYFSKLQKVKALILVQLGETCHYCTRKRSRTPRKQERPYYRDQVPPDRGLVGLNKSERRARLGFTLHVAFDRSGSHPKLISKCCCNFHELFTLLVISCYVQIVCYNDYFVISSLVNYR